MTTGTRELRVRRRAPDLYLQPDWTEYCCNSAVATVLLQQYCCNSTVATVLLQPYCCNSTWSGRVKVKVKVRSETTTVKVKVKVKVRSPRFPQVPDVPQKPLELKHIFFLATASFLGSPRRVFGLAQNLTSSLELGSTYPKDGNPKPST